MLNLSKECTSVVARTAQSKYPYADFVFMAYCKCIPAFTAGPYEVTVNRRTNRDFYKNGRRLFTLIPREGKVILRNPLRLHDLAILPSFRWVKNFPQSYVDADKLMDLILTNR